MRYLQFSLAILGLSALHLSASADEPRHAEFAKRVFASADTDGDGELTFAEFKAHVVAFTTDPNRPADAPPPPTEEQIAEHFTALDTDESGTLTLVEFQQGHRGGPRA